MKISLALGRRRPLSQQTAWGCLTTNLALPGSGSLAAGYASGYAQLALALLGLVLTMFFGLRFLSWYLDNWSRLQATETDPLQALAELWLAVRWAFLGIGLFLCGWLWALATSQRIVRAAKSASAPPPLTGTELGHG